METGWQQEAKILAAEQAQDLATPELSWWEPVQFSKSEYWPRIENARPLFNNTLTLEGFCFNALSNNKRDFSY